MNFNIASFFIICTTICVLESFNPVSSFIWTHEYHPSPIKSISTHKRRLPSSKAFMRDFQRSLHNGMHRKIQSMSSSSINDNKDKDETLIPEENPYYVNSTIDIQSKLFPYTSLKPVLDALHQLYPPKDLEKRNSISRTDGYWTYINSGETPPLQYTYGEFDFYFFADLLDRAYMIYKEHNSLDGNIDNEQGWKDKVFCDIGSGTGRLVLAAAALHPGWKLCRGVEILEGIHSVALETLERCRFDGNLVENENRNLDSNDPSIISNSRDVFLQQSINTDFMNDVMDTLNSFNSNNAGLIRTDSFDEDFNEYDDLDEDDDTTEEEDMGKDLVMDDTNLYNDEENINEYNEQKETIEYALPTVPFTDTYQSNYNSPPPSIPLAPVQFTQGSFSDPFLHLSNVDVAFVFSSCMDPSILSSLSEGLGRQCRPGSILITTDYPLVLTGTCGPEEDDPSMPCGEYEFEIVDQIDGYCWLVGGVTTAYIHVVKKSLYEEYGKEARVKPELSLEEQAWRIIKAKEDGTLTDTDKFLKSVYNKMMFLGCPPEWTSGLLD